MQTPGGAGRPERPRPPAPSLQRHAADPPDGGRVAELAGELATLFAEPAPGTRDTAPADDDSDLWELAARLAEPPPRWRKGDDARWAEARRAV